MTRTTFLGAAAVLCAGCPPSQGPAAGACGTTLAPCRLGSDCCAGFSCVVGVCRFAAGSRSGGNPGSGTGTGDRGPSGTAAGGSVGGGSTGGVRNP
ncbi:MAG TPA: hypothetical protein VMB50_10525 [Myxococcales bacterium]|nr:hypothetical protein [Myxococcales bacterium]